MFQIELYNSMVEKEGTDGEKDVMKAYRAAAAAREESDNANEVAEGEEVSSALRESKNISVPSNFFLVFFSSWYKHYQCTQRDINYLYCLFVFFRLMLCSKILNRKLMMWMPKSVIVGDYWTGL